MTWVLGIVGVLILLVLGSGLSDVVDILRQMLSTNVSIESKLDEMTASLHAVESELGSMRR